MFVIDFILIDRPIVRDGRMEKLVTEFMINTAVGTLLSTHPYCFLRVRYTVRFFFLL